MIRKSLFIILISLCFGFMGAEQDCGLYTAYKEGSVIEITNYNAQNKAESRTENTVKAIRTSGNRKTWTMEVKSYGKKEEVLADQTVEMYCENGNFVLDLKDLFKNMALPANDQFEFKLDGTPLLIPSALAVGKKLEDGIVTMRMIDRASKKEFSVMEMQMINRHVEKEETIEIASGKFKTYKIVADLNTQASAMGKNVASEQMRTIEYYSKEYGPVKTETYKGGKLMSYTVLTKYKI